jgi:hypothetical protein
MRCLDFFRRQAGLAPTGNSVSPENVHGQTSEARPLDAPVGQKAAEVLILI